MLPIPHPYSPEQSQGWKCWPTTQVFRLFKSNGSSIAALRHWAEIIRKIIETTVRHHLTPVRMAIMKNLQIANARENAEKREHSYTVSGNVCWTAALENSLDIPQKTENRITVWWSNPIPGNIPGQNYNSKWYMHPYVHSRTVYNSQNVEITEMSVIRWMDKEEMVHTYNEYYSAIERNKRTPPAATGVNWRLSY